MTAQFTLRRRRVVTAAAVLAFLWRATWMAGPLFLTDDPVPLDLSHFETYVFSQWDNAPGVGSTTDAPAVEFNWGFLPNLQFHDVAPSQTPRCPAYPTRSD